jgi:hypothetical protein
LDRIDADSLPKEDGSAFHIDEVHRNPIDCTTAVSECHPCGENLEELITSFATLSRAERGTGVKKNREDADKKIQKARNMQPPSEMKTQFQNTGKNNVPRMNLTLLGELNTR